MTVIVAKLNESREPLLVNVTFPIETEIGKQSEKTLTIWFEDDLLCEEILEASQCDSIIGMLNEKLSTGTFLSDIPNSWEYLIKI